MPAWEYYGTRKYEYNTGHMYRLIKRRIDSPRADTFNVWAMKKKMIGEDGYAQIYSYLRTYPGYQYSFSKNCPSSMENSADTYKWFLYIRQHIFDRYFVHGDVECLRTQQDTCIADNLAGHTEKTSRAGN